MVQKSGGPQVIRLSVSASVLFSIPAKSRGGHGPPGPPLPPPLHLYLWFKCFKNLVTNFNIFCHYSRVPPCLDDFVYVCDDAYSRTQIKDYERKVLGTVGFDVGYPLSYRFVRRYGRVSPLFDRELCLRGPNLLSKRLILNQFWILQVLQRSPTPQTSNWSGTIFGRFLQQTGSSFDFHKY